MMTRVGLWAGVLLASGALLARADERPGDWDAPYQVAELPFVHHGDTRGRRSRVERYALRSDLDESGPEVAYALRLDRPGTLTAWVQGDGGAVDVDVHVLSALTVEGGVAQACLARDNQACELSLPAGPAYVVVDTFAGASHAGPFRLRIDFRPDDAWAERPLARGVALRTRAYADLDGARQFACVLAVDPREPGVEVRPLGGEGCATTSAHARAGGAVAAINGGFFGAGCSSVSLLRIGGRTLATNAKDRTAIGFGDGWIRLRKVPRGADWPEARHALGGVPRLLAGGEPVVRPGDEGTAAAFATARHPRSAVALTATGGLLLATVDGRTPAGAGMSLTELARWLRQDLDAVDALNLDGGGSTTLWVADAPWDGVVNHPSDDRRASHTGQRPVSTVLGVWATPLDLPPVWLTTPPAVPLAAGGTWRYDAAVADPEGAGVSWAVAGSAPSGFALEDHGDGTATCTWPVGPGPGAVTLRATAGADAIEQRVPLLRPRSR